MNMKKMIGAIILTLMLMILVDHPAASAATASNDIHVNTNLKIYFNGIEDTSGKDGMYFNGTSYIPKTIIYSDTTYVPIRYFANMLAINQVGWDGDIPLVWVNSDKPVMDKARPKVEGITLESNMWIDQAPGKPTQFTIFPNLKLYFNGTEDTIGENGLFFNGLRDVPKSLIYKGSTYVPLRYFANQMGIANEHVGWDPKVPKLWIGPDAITYKNPIVTIEMDNGAQIVIELYPDKAPNTVTNFISLINEGFYTGLIFHRVIPGFVIQGGDPEGTGMGGPGYSISGEFASNQFTNDVLHERGVISMARSQHPDSAGSQFFLMVDDNPNLDGQYAAFGKVISGLEVVDQIVAAPRDDHNRPIDNQTIKIMTVDTFDKNYGEPIKVQ